MLGSLVLVIASFVAACGPVRHSSDAGAASSVTASSAPSGTGTSTTIAATTTATSTTTTSTTTGSPASLDALPVPAKPPQPHAVTPRVSLGTIEIPKIGVRVAMYEGVALTVLDGGPGHWPGTALPGHRGNVVIAGHRTSHARPFRHIDLLVPGDEVIFTTPEGRFVYHVIGTEVVKPTAMYILDQPATSTATLFACHPPGSTKQRIVVHLALASV